MRGFGPWRKPQSPTLFEATQAAERSLLLSNGKLPTDVTQRAKELLEKLKGRRIQDMSHTVVVFAGSTGSGKSSLFNVVLGQDVAKVAATRPTTSEALAVNAGENAAILDWLGIKQRKVLADQGVLTGGSVILVDLPDIDSTESENRKVAKDLIARSDAVIWVADPQKYADGVLHLDYLRDLTEHSGTMLVVLNQVDTLNADDRVRVTSHLRSLLHEGGIASQILVTSTVEGDGIVELREWIRDLAMSKQVAAERLAADLRAQGAAYEEAVEDSHGVLAAPEEIPDFAAVIRSLNLALGTPVVVQAARDSYIHRGVGATGWLWTKWLRQFRADPLRRLHLGKSLASEPLSERGAAEHGVGAPAAASSIATDPALESAARSGVRRYAQDAATNLPRRWRNKIVTEVESGASTLVDAADVLFSRIAPTLGRRPKWWSLARGLQWTFALTAVVGFAWLAVYWIADWFKINLPEPPYWGPIAVPTVLLVGGLVVGWLLAVLARLLLNVGARRLANTAAQTLHEGITEAARTEIVEPLERNLRQYAMFAEDVSVMLTVKR